VEVQSLENKIREILARLAQAEDEDVSALAQELRALLHSHAEYVRAIAYGVLTHIHD
jgi:hypothetical protein